MNISSVFFILAFICAIGVVGVLGVGLFGMARNSDADKKRGNKMMQARVWLQGLAVLFLVLGFLAAEK